MSNPRLKEQLKTRFVTRLKKQHMETMLSDGKVCTISFRKKDGSMRDMNCRRGVSIGITGKGTKKPQKSNLLTVWDMQKGAYRTVNLDTVETIKSHGLIWNVDRT